MKLSFCFFVIITFLFGCTKLDSDKSNLVTDQNKQTWILKKGSIIKDCSPAGYVVNYAMVNENYDDEFTWNNFLSTEFDFALYHQFTHYNFDIYSSDHLGKKIFEMLGLIKKQNNEYFLYPLLLEKDLFNIYPRFSLGKKFVLVQERIVLSLQGSSLYVIVLGLKRDLIHKKDILPL